MSLVPVGFGVNAGGLKTNLNVKAMHIRGHAIKGLYAAGNSAALLDNLPRTMLWQKIEDLCWVSVKRKEVIIQKFNRLMYEFLAQTMKGGNISALLKNPQGE